MKGGREGGREGRGEKGGREVEGGREGGREGRERSGGNGSLAKNLGQDGKILTVIILDTNKTEIKKAPL